MSGHLSEEAVKQHVRIYRRVFLALGALTVLTVAVSYFHFSVAVAVAVALFIAVTKGSLVAAYFMHLKTERKIVWGILAMTFFFFVFLLTAPSLHHR
ncbi:MAG: cytochrome C oxidase subunit IV family protein [Candidatus Omnitrophica bacterium]|nr:cytochrome C oxidase subunit IV family protein [Candidatus Omnitrophota bacterium]